MEKEKEGWKTRGKGGHFSTKQRGGGGRGYGEKDRGRRG